mgnify:CR=1 FL=1
MSETDTAQKHKPARVLGRVTLHWIRAFFVSRFGNPDTDPSYFNEWVSRFAGLDCDSLIPHQMDYQSRRVWGKVTGLKYGLIKYNYTIDPVFEVVDLKTGLTTTQTAFELKPDIDYTLED